MDKDSFDFTMPLKLWQSL